MASPPTSATRSTRARWPAQRRPKVVRKRYLATLSAWRFIRDDLPALGASLTLDLPALVGSAPWGQSGDTSAPLQGCQHQPLARASTTGSIGAVKSVDGYPLCLTEFLLEEALDAVHSAPVATRAGEMLQSPLGRQLVSGEVIADSDLFAALDLDPFPRVGILRAMFGPFFPTFRRSRNRFCRIRPVRLSTRPVSHGSLARGRWP